MDLLRIMLVYMTLLAGTATMSAGVTPIPYDLLRTPTPVPTATPIPTPTPVPTPEPTATPTPKPLILGLNNYGDDVQKLQARLIELGYLKGKDDGYFGPKTEKAVKLFQEVNGLKADGYAGPATFEKLYDDPDVVPAYTPTPVPFSP